MNLIPAIVITCAQLKDISARVENSQKLSIVQKTEIIQIMKDYAPQCKIFEGK